MAEHRNPESADFPRIRCDEPSSAVLMSESGNTTTVSACREEGTTPVQEIKLTPDPDRHRPRSLMRNRRPLRYVDLFWRIAFFSLQIGILAEMLLPYGREHLPTIVYKATHCIEFGMLALVATLAFPLSRLWRIGEAVTVMAGVVELLQLIPGLHRNASLLDFLFETLTIFGVLTLFGLLTGRVEAE